jgi:zinc D-Ala-D-Ala carboxypeptidase
VKQFAFLKIKARGLLQFFVFFIVGISFIAGGHNYYASARSQASIYNHPAHQSSISSALQPAVSNIPVPTTNEVYAATPAPSDVPALTKSDFPQESLQDSTTAIASASVATKYNHFPYKEAPTDALIGVGNGQRLHQESGTAMKAMVQAAKKDGVHLFPLSGYRSYSLQSELFKAQINRRGSVKVAAKISAPPGYSEHHTGYAMDFGDRDQSSTDLEETFEQTSAFRWLAQNAYQYGFEMSFVRNNAQGIIYEPWHWRFVNSQRAVQIFAQARQPQIGMTSNAGRS